MAEKHSERLPVVPPRQYDEAVEAIAAAKERSFRPAEFALYANGVQQVLDEDVLTELLDYATTLEPLMSTKPADRNVSLARLIIRAAMQTENDIARRRHKTVPYKKTP